MKKHVYGMCEHVVIHSRREYPYNEHIDMCIKQVLSIVELIKLIIMLPKFKLYIFISYKIDEKNLYSPAALNIFEKPFIYIKRNCMGLYYMMQ